MTSENWYRQDGEYRMINGIKVPGFIGGTRHFKHICGKNIVTDSGVGFDINGDVKFQYLPDWDNYIGIHIHIIILTHKHFDHNGSFPPIVWHHPEAIVLMANKAFEGTSVALEDSLQIYGREAEAAKKKGLPIPKPVFTAEQLDFFYDNPKLRTFNLPWWFYGVDLNKEFETDEWTGWEFGFSSAGHDVGAASIWIIAPNGEGIFLTGDTASHPTVVEGMMLPDDHFLGDFLNRKVTMITEATNGGRRMTKPRSEVNGDYAELIGKTYHRGGIVFNPSYAASKPTDRVRKSLRALEELRIPDCTIVVDGLARDHMRVECPELDELIKSGKVFFIEEGKSKEAKELAWKQRGEFAGGERGFPIIIAASATLNQGFAASAYAPIILPNEKNTVVFTGHVFDDSIAKTLLQIERGRTIKLNRFVKSAIEPIYVNVRCKEICHLDDSFHDYQDGLVERVRLVQPETLLVHHCPGKESFDAFADRVRALPKPPKVLKWALNGEVIYI